MREEPNYYQSRDLGSSHATALGFELSPRNLMKVSSYSVPTACDATLGRAASVETSSQDEWLVHSGPLHELFELPAQISGVNEGIRGADV